MRVLLLCTLSVCVCSFAIFLVSLGLLGLSLVVGQEFQKLVRSGKVLKHLSKTCSRIRTGSG
jgi:hypothetical protein